MLALWIGIENEPPMKLGDVLSEDWDVARFEIANMLRDFAQELEKT